MNRPSPSPRPYTLTDSLRTVLRDESGRQNELMIFVAMVGILAAVAIPKVMSGRMSQTAVLIHAGALLAGCGLFTLIHNRIVDEGDQLPMGGVVIFCLVGLAFVNRFGWVSTGVLIGIYGAACLHDAFEYRRRQSRDKG